MLSVVEVSNAIPPISSLQRSKTNTKMLFCVASRITQKIKVVRESLSGEEFTLERAK